MTLTELLATDDYVGLTDVAAAALANQRRHSGERRLSYLRLSSLLDPNIVRRLIATVDAVAASDTLVAEVRNFLRSDGGVDVGNAVTQAMLDQFAANEQLPLTAADATAIKALADNMHSDAELHGLGVVKVGHVQMARG